MIKMAKPRPIMLKNIVSSKKAVIGLQDKKENPHLFYNKYG